MKKIKNPKTRLDHIVNNMVDAHIDEAMTIASFKRTAKVDEFNTNNGWGFGGHIDKRWSLKGFHIRRRKACYRHAPSLSWTEYFVGSEEVTKAQFLEAINTKKA